MRHRLAPTGHKRQLSNNGGRTACCRLLALLLLVVAPAAGAVPRTVATELVSPWAETPLLLEGLALLARSAPEPRASFWDYLTRVRGARGAERSHGG